MKVLNLTKDHLRLIPFILINNDKDDVLEINKTTLFTIQSSILEDMSLLLGLRDKAIPKTENDANGRAFPDEVEKYMLDIYHYVIDNLYYIETLIHQFVVLGGLTEGTYVSDEKNIFWEKKS